jgi:predicted transcriptional regulator
MAEHMVTTGSMTHTEVERVLKVSRSTLYRALKKANG